MKPGPTYRGPRRRAAWLVAIGSWSSCSACAGDSELGGTAGARDTAAQTAAGNDLTGNAMTASVATAGTNTTLGNLTTDGTPTSGAGPDTASGSSWTASGSTSFGSSVTASGDASTSGSTGSSTTLAAATGVGGASSGMTGTDTTGAGGSSTSGEFQLSWADEFDTIDTSRWQPMTHSWEGNLAQFSAETVAATNGVLSLSLAAAADGSDKPYLGVEYRSLDTLTYGKVEARVRFARGSAVVSSLVLIYTPWPPDDWNELDIEYLGTGQMQFNHMINIPPADPISGHLQYPRIVELGFDPAADFHEYAIEWVPGEARFLVDGTLRHTATEEMSRMVLPQNILLTIWASDAADWAGPVDATTAPTTAEYDWIRVYDYVER